MDIPRVVDEFGKYYFQNRIMHSSFHGVRGSFLLTSGKIENAIGWDTACLTEDYDFAWKASSYSLLFLSPSDNTLIVRNAGMEEGFPLWLDIRDLPRTITDFFLRQPSAAPTLVPRRLASWTHLTPPTVSFGTTVNLRPNLCAFVSDEEEPPA